MSDTPFESYFQGKDNWASHNKIQFIYCTQNGQSAKNRYFQKWWLAAVFVQNLLKGKLLWNCSVMQGAIFMQNGSSKKVVIFLQIKQIFQNPRILALLTPYGIFFRKENSFSN